MSCHSKLIAIGSDHAGVELKKLLIEHLAKRNIPTKDMGTFSSEAVDYPDYAKKVAEIVKNGECNKGVLICGTGIGVSIVANKIPGIRAALCTSVKMAEMSKKHNDANVLVVGSKIISIDSAKEILDVWLDTDFEGGRHSRRLDKIQEIERENLKICDSKEKWFMKNVFVFRHPLIQHKVSMLRDENTGTKEFRELVSEIAMLMAYEVTRGVPLKEVDIKTPLGIAKANMISGKKIGVVPILRAGLGMVDGMATILPLIKVGHIGLYRDPETLEPVEYYCKLPVDAAERDIVMLDPMLATGGSASAAIKFVKDKA